jgi:hypothetical protein
VQDLPQLEREPDQNRGHEADFEDSGDVPHTPILWPSP